jgi:hypothetical protein
MIVALARMRLAAFLRTGRALAPLLAVLIVLGVLYGGGAARAGEAYGVSAVMLFPVLAWQTKLLLDVEPDVQRRIARVSMGPRGEAVAGLLAAMVAAAGAGVLALAVPWIVGGIAGPSIVSGLAWGLWAHLLAAVAGVALGALASRATTRTALYGVTVLAVGVVCGLVFGLKSSIAPWLAPPLLATARALTANPGPTAATAVTLTGHALLWGAVLLGLYGLLRRTRS